MAYEYWDGTQMDVKFTQSVNGGGLWTPPVVVNDDASGTDQFQPSVAAGPGGAVAVAFYDRRQACPNDVSIRPQDVGRTNFCIDTSLQTYSDSGAGAVPVGGNTRMSTYTWDPMQPDQHVGGIGQMACAAHQDPCTSNAFIGDYFGLAVSDGEHLRLLRLDALPVGGAGGRGRPGLLPAAGAGDGSALGPRL